MTGTAPIRSSAKKDGEQIGPGHEHHPGALANSRTGQAGR
jgi:hypothetical protein